MGILQNQLKGTNLGLKGSTPDLRAGALPTSQLHAQGAAPASMKADHSIYDLDGGVGIKGKYVDNAPESGISDRILDLTPPQ